MASDKMSIQRIYTHGFEKAEICCPECKFSKTINVKVITRFGVPTTIKCKCGYNFKIMFESRKSYRKTTKLTGVCRKVHEESYITICDLSGGGIGFILDSSSMKVQVGNFLQVEFRLNDLEKTMVRAGIHVISVDGQRIGAEFVPSADVNKKVGFYLMQ